MKSFFKISTLFILLYIVLISCNKKSFISDLNAKLIFSTDTVMFDTVFTGIGSAVRHFRVYNPHDQPIKISEINIALGSDSKYRLNINGIPANSLNNIEIDANDSIFIFVDVKIDPDQDDIIEQDQVIFFTNGNKQVVNLIAFGKDIHLINGSYIGTETWTSDKPYLIYNSMAVDENNILTIEQGSHLYFHRNSRMIILGTLEVNGTFEEPVIFEGDRLNDHSSIFFENDSLDNYDNISGQWEGIWLTKLSKDNSIDFAEIKNAITGIQIDSSQNINPQLRISNTKIEHHSFAGIYAQISSISATNCLFSDCGYYNIILTRGGIYEFYHCTIGNYWSGARNTPAVYFNNYYKHPDGTIYLYDLNNAYFGNCIIWGNIDTEVGIDGIIDQGASFNYKFENCLLKIDPESDINTTDMIHFKNPVLNNDPLFTDHYNFYFKLI